MNIYMKNTTTKKKTSTRSRSRTKKSASPSAFERVTEVRTGYARLALMLVLANLFLTGYVISKISTLEADAQAEGNQNTGQPVTTPSEPDGGDI